MILRYSFLFTVLWAACIACSKRAPADEPAAVVVPDAVAAGEKEMKSYLELIEHTRVKVKLVPIPAGKFVMGSPASEANRERDEGPQHEVAIDAFWMSECEITWEAYEAYMLSMDVLRREVLGLSSPRDKLVDAVTRPTKPYCDMTFGMGKRGYPAICMTQHAARTFCQWLTAKTGRYYRLPTEAEWEYACRAGTKTAYSFGDDPAKLGEFAWYYENSDDQYHKVRSKKPNAWGLYDMHGNVAEWVLDQHVTNGYARHSNANPLLVPTQLYPRVVRGGSWEDDPELCRSAARRGSEEDWKSQDPQTPRSIWYHTDALGIGFRIVRPLHEPGDEAKASKWEKTAPEQKDPEGEGKR